GVVRRLHLPERLLPTLNYFKQSGQTFLNYPERVTGWTGWLAGSALARTTTIPCLSIQIREECTPTTAMARTSNSGPCQYPTFWPAVVRCRMWMAEGWCCVGLVWTGLGPATYARQVECHAYLV